MDNIMNMSRLSGWICPRHLTAYRIKSSHPSCLHMDNPIKQYYFLKSYLSDRTQRIKLNNIVSSW